MGGDRMKRTARRWLALAGAAATIAATASVGLSSEAVANSAVTGAGFTTVDEGVDGTGHCKNGHPEVNCNIYDGKQYVWLNGGPSTAYVGDGDYFFAVLDPGGQADPNDGGVKNLSDDFDAYTNRTFSVSGGTVSYSGSHDFDPNKIRLIDYSDTSNPGGVYILAVCSLADGYPVNASDCKYDAFKVQEGETVTPPADTLTVTKNADGGYDTSYVWDIDKSVDKTKVMQVGGNAVFNYTVEVSHDAGTDSNITVTGQIDVTNPNFDANFNTVPADISSLTDELSDSTSCDITDTNGDALTFPVTLTDFSNHFLYSCTLSAVPTSALDNTVTVEWQDQFLDNGAELSGGSANFIFQTISFDQNTIDECTDVTDTYAGSLGTVCVGDDNPTDFTYQRSIAVQSGCIDYDNTGSFITNDTDATDSDSQTVTVCGPLDTGALTMGFWQNKNGQAIIKAGAPSSGTCNSATWLRQYAPFQDLSATASCNSVAAYVAGIVKVASASGASMNAMLKAQMLATALDVYFSDPALGGNKINAPAPVGGVTIDLTLICKDAAHCSLGFENASSAFGGATSLTVSQILAYAASQSNVGGGSWYGNVKSTQELAKDTFDAVNNEVAFGA